MALKANGDQRADEVIISSIMKMAVLNVKRPAENKALQEGYKVAIEEILSIDGAPELLRDAVRSMENDAHYRYEYNSTVLHKAAHNGHPEIIKLLFLSGWKVVDPGDVRNKTPIYFAVVSDHVEAAKELLLHRPDLIRDGYTTQPIAKVMRNLSVWKDIFIEYAQSNFDGTPIHLSKSLIAEISAAVHCSHMSYMDLENFYKDMNFDITGLFSYVSEH